MRLLHLTLHVRLTGTGPIEDMHAAGKRYLVSFWHCHLLLMVFGYFQRPICVMISRHRDGELIARTMRRFGVDSSRGSSSRGGPAALKELIDFAAYRGSIAITPDGPRGPRCVAAAGVVRAAQSTRLPLMPVAFISERKKLLRSWDRFEIPLPFSRAMFVYGEQIHVPSDLGPEDVESWRAEIEHRMNELVEHAENNFDEMYASGLTMRQLRRRNRRKE